MVRRIPCSHHTEKDLTVVKLSCFCRREAYNWQQRQTEKECCSGDTSSQTDVRCLSTIVPSFRTEDDPLHAPHYGPSGHRHAGDLFVTSVTEICELRERSDPAPRHC